MTCRAVVLALGGGSWARLGSDGAWVPLLAERGVAWPRCARPTAALMWRACTPLRAKRAGPFARAAGPHTRRAGGLDAAFRAERFAGQPFKSVALSFTSSTGQHFQRRGEFVATATGVGGQPGVRRVTSVAR